MDGRTISSELYRFGFNGQEKVDEISGSGNHTTAMFWEYDSRLARRWNQDPKPNPSISNYATFANNPIWFSDELGDTIRVEGSKAFQRSINFKLNIMRIFGKKEIRNIIRDLRRDTDVVVINDNASSVTSTVTKLNNPRAGSSTIELDSGKGAYNKLGFPAEGGGWMRVNLKQALVNELSHGYDNATGAVVWTSSSHTWPGGLVESFYDDEPTSNERQNMVIHFGKKRFVNSHSFQASAIFNTKKDARRFSRVMNLYNRNPDKAHKKINALDAADLIKTKSNTVINDLYE